GGSRPGLPEFVRPMGGVFFKAAKPGQDRRIDLPAIGPDTIRRAAAAGLNGIVVERGGVLVLDADGITAQLRSTGLFLAAWDR
ncbi:MAG: UDP-2,3-diacylglucosamine diphosphatase LpxI, partial [Jannaschia sp.]